jgi:hypothetical protein
MLKSAPVREVAEAHSPPRRRSPSARPGIRRADPPRARQLGHRASVASRRRRPRRRPACAEGAGASAATLTPQPRSPAWRAGSWRASSSATGAARLRNYDIFAASGGCGGIGRRARFRSVSGQPGGGSSPLIRIGRTESQPVGSRRPVAQLTRRQGFGSLRTAVFCAAIVQGTRTPPSHGGNPGSNPGSGTRPFTYWPTGRPQPSAAPASRSSRLPMGREIPRDHPPIIGSIRRRKGCRASHSPPGHVHACPHSVLVVQYIPRGRSTSG